MDMISTKDYLNILRVCASQEAVKKAVFQNYNNNLWWPLSIRDWRIRMLIAGLSLRVSYRMIETFRKVVNELSSYTYEEISLMNRDKFKSIVRPIGLIKLRVRFFLSTLDFVNYVERNKLDIYSMSHDELINLLRDKVFGIGYHGAQCCALYILGYHCGIMPVDSGMKRLFCPCIGLPAPNAPYGYEILRKQLENLTRSIDYNQIAVKEGYEYLNLRESKQLAWWAHLVLIYYKRFFCNKSRPDLCPLKNILATKEIIGQMCPKKHKEVGGIKNVVIEGINKVGKTTLAEMFYSIGFKKSHADYHRRIKNLYLFYKNFLERKPRTKRFVLDRTFISEAVYGPVLREKSRLSEIQLESLLKKLKEQNTILVYLYAPLGVLLERKSDQQYELQKYYSGLTKAYESVIAIVRKYIPVIKIDSNKNNPAQIFSQITGFEFVKKNK